MNRSDYCAFNRTGVVIGATGSKLRCMRSTPTEMQSMSENDFECFASTGVNTLRTTFPNSGHFEDTSAKLTSGQLHVSFAENQRCDPMSAFG
jgi:hypothetical protein